MSFRNRPSQDSRVDPCDGYIKVVTAYGRFARRISSIGGMLLMVVVIGDGSMVLSFFASYVARPDQLAGSDKVPGGGIIVRSEVTHLYLPRILIDLANPTSCQSEPPGTSYPS
jgi:hypothetical protein